jgi:hypothetical protein
MSTATEFKTNHAFVTLALTFNVRVEDAYVLPALFERSAELTGRRATDLIEETQRNPALGRYMAEAAAKVAAADREMI